ncbi:hypothetical protein AA313_de0207863 [Arthrobotrys entomopaga]|nr:hypothetical protein AA313_de0207863 [Arthrobotrys entomopaga]
MASERAHKRQKHMEESAAELHTIPDKLNLLDTGAEWDVLILVGAEKKSYRLHEAVLAGQGGYFAAKTWTLFKEGKSRTWVFNSFEEEAFDEVVKWLYGGGFTLGPSNFMWAGEIYQMADFLLLPQLKSAVTAELYKEIACEVPLLFINAMKADPNFCPFELFGSIFRCALPSEYDAVKLYTDYLAQRFTLDKKSAKAIAFHDSSGTYIAALLTSYSEVADDKWLGSA